MKKIKIALLSVLLAVFILPSCKKGPDDPFFSLRSRKARLTGTWTLSSGSITLNGLTTTYPIPKVTKTIQFNKDNSFTETDVDTTGTYITSGTWDFFDKTKGGIKLKNKEAIILIPTQTIYNSVINTTWTGFDLQGSTLWMLDKLANKAMIVKFNSTETVVSGGNYAIAGTWTFKKS